MAGGFLGYVYVIAGCAVFLGLLAACVLLLYGVARIRGRRDTPRVRVVAVRSETSSPDA